MKDSARQDFHSALTNKAYPRSSKSTVDAGLSNEDLASWLRSSLGG